MGFLGNSKIVNENCEFKYSDIDDKHLTTPFQRQNVQLYLLRITVKG